ncbi:helix-turn-helix domain-containing protein [Amycolatopsis sp. NPDC051061]|uniref:nSTAND1 domain-containing NTPase n=1 Tax=Amycolatopsis sp. NPDC051061 TaxID=3155042 RepID=UPI003428AE7B
MPRSERPLEGDDALSRFAAELRQLREKAGKPPYRELARQAHYSSTTLADAAGGRRLPSLAVTLAFVEACGGDPAEWEQHWRDVAGTQTLDQPEDDLDTGTPCPYPGLAAFQPEDAERFHGREALTQDLVSRVAERRFVAVFGASGSGKSSLIRAGLVPRRQPDGPVIVFTPGADPLDECAARIAAFAGGSAIALRRELGSDRRALHLTVLQALANGPADAELLLVIDQFEELFTLCSDAAERAAFIDAVLTAAQAGNSRTRVVIGVRADFYAHCAEHAALVEALRDAQLLVGRMTTDELRRAISQPTVDDGGAVESALLAKVIADAAGQPNTLPLVSHALRETWYRRRGTMMTLNGYEASGGMHQALARTAETVYTGLTPDRQRLARAVLLRLIALNAGADDTKRRARHDELPADATPVLDTMVRARLVTVDADTVELTHEALLHAWPRLRDWVAEDRQGLLVHQQLLDAALTWDREGRDPAALYRGNRLAMASEWATHHREDVQRDPRLQRFLASSTGRQNRARRLTRAAVAVLAVLTVAASTAAVYARQQRDIAQAQRDTAVAMHTADEAQQVHDTDISLSAQFSLAAERMKDAPQERAAVLGSQNVALSSLVDGGTKTVYGAAFSSDRRTLATVGTDGAVRLWNISDPTHVTLWTQPLTGHQDRAMWVAFSPNGRLLATAGRDHTVRLWDVADPAHAGPAGPPLLGHSDIVFSVSFSPDGRTLVSAGADRTVRLWNVTDPAHATPIGHPLVGHTDAVASATFSPDGRTIASSGHDHVIRLWNVTDLADPTMWGPPLTGHSDTVYATAFTPDSHLMASVGNDHTVLLWDVSDPAHPTRLGHPLTGHTNSVFAVAFNHDGTVLATAGADQTIRLWNLSQPSDPVPLGRPLTGHTSYIYWLAFSADGKTLASVGADSMVRLWRLPETVLIGHTSYVNGVVFRRDGKVLASASTDRTVRLWDTTDPRHPTPLGQPLTGNTKAVNQVAFSPDGHTLASAGRDGTVRLWDVADLDHATAWPDLVSGSSQAVTEVAFTPDGHILAAAGADGVVRLWNVTNREHVTPVTTLLGHSGSVTWLTISPDGHELAASGTDDTVLLWDITDPGRPGQPRRLTTNTGGVQGVAFAPNGRYLATADTDHTVRLWDVSGTGTPQQLGAPLIGHTSFVYQVTFTADGAILASTGQDGMIRLWDVRDPADATPIGQALTTHTAPIDGAVFSPDGTVLATAGDDRTVQLTAMDVQEAARHICADTAGVLTPQRWAQHVPEATFPAPCG